MPADHYDHLDQTFVFHDIIGYVCVPNNHIDEKNSENIIDLAQMKNPENSQFPPFLLGFEDFCIDEQK